MIKSLLFIIFIGFSALRFSDFESDSAFYSVFLPVCVFFSFISLALWFVIVIQNKGISQTTKPDRSGGFFGGPGDGGSCD